MATEAQVLDALRAIIDPDFGKDIVSLGFIKNLAIDSGRVAFDVELTTPACPVKDQFRSEAESLVAALEGVDEVAVNMTSQPRAPRQAPEQSGLQGVRSLIAVSSCKGGVGKSTVAAGLARVLAQRGHKIGLLDADIYGPSIPTLFDLHPGGVKADKDNMMIPAEVDGLKIMSFGFLMGRDPAVMRGPMVANYMQQLLHKVAWGDLDILVMDLPPGTGDVQLTICQSVQLDGAVIVSTPQALSLVDVEKGIIMFDKVSVPVLGMIENMAYFVCDDCDKKHYVFGQGTESLTERYGIDILAQLPLSPAEYGRSFDTPVDSEGLRAAADAVVRAIGKSSHERVEKPEVEFDASRIKLTWSDGSVTEVGNFDLRTACRCALCVDEMTGEQKLKQEDVAATVMPQEINTIGNYAIQVTWSDGHSSGLASYQVIRKVAGEPSGV